MIDYKQWSLKLYRGTLISSVLQQRCQQWQLLFCIDLKHSWVMWIKHAAACIRLLHLRKCSNLEGLSKVPICKVLIGRGQRLQSNSASKNSQGRGTQTQCAPGLLSAKTKISSHSDHDWSISYIQLLGHVDIGVILPWLGKDVSQQHFAIDVAGDVIKHSVRLLFNTTASNLYRYSKTS